MASKISPKVRIFSDECAMVVCQPGEFGQKMVIVLLLCPFCGLENESDVHDFVKYGFA